MIEKLKSILEDAKKDLAQQEDLQGIEEFRVAYLGKKGRVKEILKGMGKLSPEERPVIGQFANEVRDEIEGAIESMKTKLSQKALEKKLAAEEIDITMPATRVRQGHKHPLNGIIDDITDIFVGMGFKLAEGPEIETVYHNFDALNSPQDHPARSTSDTFYFTPDVLLRTHTSPVQIRTMKENEPPIKIVAIGRCFRNDEIDATHSPMFHQMEGLVVGEDITMADLKGTLNQFVHRLFGDQTKTKFRPHYFPFTEPSAEVDVTCFKCGGEGCKFCSGSGWIEILGCGMVHPNVLAECGIDPDKYSGFAFGMGLDRITMLKYEIDDIRHLFENDIRFIQQF